MNRQEPASGRFVLRLDPGLHGSLRAAARARGVSLNEYCATKLAMPVVDAGSFAGASVVIKRAAAVVGEALIAVVAFGSWARGELADSSDIDILIVVDSEVLLSRSLYRRWDEEPLRWEGHPVEPHFVHMPPRDGVPSGLWARLPWTESCSISAILGCLSVWLAYAGCKRQGVAPPDGPWSAVLGGGLNHAQPRAREGLCRPRDGSARCCGSAVQLGELGVTVHGSW